MQNAKAAVRCHIKIDTGMGRIGLKYRAPEECAVEIRNILSLDKLSVEGLYTHLRQPTQMMRKAVNIPNVRRILLSEPTIFLNQKESFFRTCISSTAQGFAITTIKEALLPGREL